MFDTSLCMGSTSGEPALSFAVDSSAPGRGAGSRAFPDRAGMKESLQVSSAPAKGWGIACPGPTAAWGGRQRQGSAVPAHCTLGWAALLGTAFKGSGVGG